MTALAHTRTKQPMINGRSQVDLVKSLVAKGCSDDELSLMLYTADKLKLDLLTNQIYAIKVWDADKKGMVLKPYLGIDALRIVAQRSGEYEGQVGPFWYDKDMGWCDFWVEDYPPLAAKVGINRKGFREPVWGIAKLSTYIQKHKDKHSGDMVPTGFWAKGPEMMLAKVAEALALRKAFPNDLSGLYSVEEMSHVENVAPYGHSEPIKMETAELGPSPYTGQDHQKRLVLQIMKESGIEDIEVMQRVNGELISMRVPFKKEALEHAVREVIKR